MIKLIIFDFSGVCFSSEEPEYFAHLAKQFHLDLDDFYGYYLELLPESEVDNANGKDVLRKTFAKFNLKITPEKAIEDMMKLKVMKQETFDLIKELKKDYLVSYFTNYNKDFWEEIERIFDLSEYFDFGLVSYQARSRKPAAEGFKVILDHFNVKPEEAVFLDDNKTNLVEPAKLGIKTIHFQGLKQLKREISAL